MQRKRRAFSGSERDELWRRWKDGQSLSDISRALSTFPGTVHRFLSIRGGIAPSVRRRSPRALSLADREEISRGLSVGNSVRGIAAQLGRAASTISREIERNEGRAGYRAAAADSLAWARARRPKLCKLARHRRLQRSVASKLRLEWSPEQIAGWLRQRFPGDDRMNVSHETIYRSLFIQARACSKRSFRNTFALEA